MAREHRVETVAPARPAAAGARRAARGRLRAAAKGASAWKSAPGRWSVTNASEVRHSVSVAAIQARVRRYGDEACVRVRVVADVGGEDVQVVEPGRLRGRRSRPASGRRPRRPRVRHRRVHPHWRPRVADGIAVEERSTLIHCDGVRTDRRARHSGRPAPPDADDAMGDVEHRPRQRSTTAPRREGRAFRRLAPSFSSRSGGRRTRPRARPRPATTAPKLGSGTPPVHRARAVRRRTRCGFRQAPG